MSSPTIWSTGRYEAVGERIAPIAAEVVDAADQWGNPETITARLSDGFVDVTIENDTHTWEFPSLDAAVNFVTNESPLQVSVFGNVDAAKREQLRAAFEAAMRAHRDDAGVRFDAPYVVVTARRR